MLEDASLAAGPCFFDNDNDDENDDVSRRSSRPGDSRTFNYTHWHRDWAKAISKWQSAFLTTQLLINSNLRKEDVIMLRLDQTVCNDDNKDNSKP